MGGFGASSIIAPQHPSRSTASPSSTSTRAVSDNGNAISPPRRSNHRPACDRRRRPPTRRSRNIQQEYQRLVSQIKLLLGTASLSFLLFLLFALPAGALVGLTIAVTSLGACLLVAAAAIKTWYRLEMEHPLGLVRRLPAPLRAYLTERSLHDCLAPSLSQGSLSTMTQAAEEGGGRRCLKGTRVN